MSTVNVVSPSSEKAGTAELPDAIFGAKVGAGAKVALVIGLARPLLLLTHG